MSNKKIYEKYIKRCIQLAKKGEGDTAPNPLVGAVLLDENLNFVSEGFHQKYGEAHAEVNAIKSAKKNFKNGTIIVNLEPCSHFGKTPPCADLIIKSGIKGENSVQIAQRIINENTDSKRCIHSNVHSSVTYNSQNMGPTSMLINR